MRQLFPIIPRGRFYLSSGMTTRLLDTWMTRCCSISVPFHCSHLQPMRIRCAAIAACRRLYAPLICWFAAPTRALDILLLRRCRRTITSLRRLGGLMAVRFTAAAVCYLLTSVGCTAAAARYDPITPLQRPHVGPYAIIADHHLLRRRCGVPDSSMLIKWDVGGGGCLRWASEMPPLPLQLGSCPSGAPCGTAHGTRPVPSITVAHR